MTEIVSATCAIKLQNTFYKCQCFAKFSAVRYKELIMGFKTLMDENYESEDYSFSGKTPSSVALHFFH